jgi:hypothetical protein
LAAKKFLASREDGSVEGGARGIPPRPSIPPPLNFLPRKAGRVAFYKYNITQSF